MRKWHRWLSVLFGLLILFVAGTGLLSHAAALWPVAEAPVVAPPAGFACPESMICSPKPPTTGPRSWVRFLHHVHAGEEFGKGGIILSIASGIALIFFAFSGLWMYIEMFRRRSHRESNPKRIFW